MTRQQIMCLRGRHDLQLNQPVGSWHDPADAMFIAYVQRQDLAIPA